MKLKKIEKMLRNTQSKVTIKVGDSVNDCTSEALHNFKNHDIKEIDFGNNSITLYPKKEKKKKNEDIDDIKREIDRIVKHDYEEETPQRDQRERNDRNRNRQDHYRRDGGRTRSNQYQNNRRNDPKPDAPKDENTTPKENTNSAEE